MPQPSAQVTAAEISRIAGVTRATVSNWRRRHDDFPAPSGGTDTSPLYDLEAVRGWLEARGQSSAATPSEELRTVLRLHGSGAGVAARLFPLVLATSRRSANELTALDELPDSDVIAQADSATAELAGSVPEAEAVHFRTDDVGALRALIRCVRDEGAQSTLDVLAERELDDTASSGTYQTPLGLADLMARLLPGRTTRVLDPACGSGSLLAAAARQGATELYGQDSLPVQAQRSAVRLLLSAPDAQVTVRAGDTLRADAFPELRVGGVLCNPPYGDRDWGHEELAYDQRWAYGVPPRIESELAWTQHALAHLEPGGYAVMVLPPATAARASGRRIRAELVRSGALRAVVGLPIGASAPLHIGMHVWVLQRPEPGGTDSKSVLFVDVSGDQREGPPSSPRDAYSRLRHRRTGVDWNTLSEEVLGHWTAYTDDPESFTDAPGIARAVPTIDLVDDLVDLTPARQVRAAPVDIDPAEVAQRTEERRKLLAASLNALESAAGYGPWKAATESSRAWRTATVSDLARGGALSLLRAAVPAGRGDARTGSPNTDGAERPVLTASDIGSGARPSGTAEDLRTDATHTVAAGDVLVRGVAGGSGIMVRVADEADAEALLGHHIHLLRPDPARLDPWFLAGFLGAEDNIAGASTGSTILHVSPGRLRVPLLPLEEQRRYGAAFRRAYELRTAARQTAELAEETAQALLTGLTAGALLPPLESPLA
ncbi:N-6 DNA methylase [Streptomyces sp. NBC_00873]|uniref:N-6 DNA methylase n=1 Tax=unclassified Streptomyces TaxID=2593676 RepID=UPI00386A1633|nr:N-6 DNA methylase [Streptomyces sp. NBC_00873]WTA47556.1 N-6 DNA methylase [Streptomyces sp. NBC_00842]